MAKGVLVLYQLCDLHCRTIGLIYGKLHNLVSKELGSSVSPPGGRGLRRGD